MGGGDAWLNGFSPTGTKMYNMAWLGAHHGWGVILCTDIVEGVI